MKFFGPEVLYIGKIGGEGSSQWGFDQGLGGGVGVAADIHVDTFLVVKLTISDMADSSFADLYINPALGTDAPLTPDIAGYQFNSDAVGNRGIDEIRLGGQGPADSGSQFAADEIRIGSTFGDVAIPEPTTGALLLGAVAALVTRRRRTE